MSEEHTYRSFLLRIWRTGSRRHSVWRASLEDARTGNRLGFANLGRLYEFLLEQTEAEADALEPPASDAPQRRPARDDAP